MWQAEEDPADHLTLRWRQSLAQLTYSVVLKSKCKKITSLFYKLVGSRFLSGSGKLKAILNYIKGKWKVGTQQTGAHCTLEGLKWLEKWDYIVVKTKFCLNLVIGSLGIKNVLRLIGL